MLAKLEAEPFIYRRQFEIRDGQYVLDYYYSNGVIETKPILIDEKEEARLQRYYGSQK